MRRLGRKIEIQRERERNEEREGKREMMKMVTFKTRQKRREIQLIKFTRL